MANIHSTFGGKKDLNAINFAPVLESKPDVRSSIPSKKGLIPKIGGLMAVIDIAGSIVGAEVSLQPARNVFLHTATPDVHGQSRRLDDYLVFGVGDIIFSGNHHENEPEISYFPNQKPILYAGGNVYNGDATPFMERTEASPVTKRRNVNINEFEFDSFIEDGFEYEYVLPDGPVAETLPLRATPVEILPFDFSDHLTEDDLPPFNLGVNNERV